MSIIKRVAIVLILVGTVALVTSAGAFSAITADRAISAQSAPQDTAFIALEPTGNTVDDQNNPTLIGEIRNNIDQPATVTFTVESGYAGVSVDPQNGEQTLSPGETIDLEATCNPPNGGQSTTTVTVTFDAGGGDISVSSGTLTTQVAYDCPGRDGGPPGGGGPPGRGGGGPPGQ